MGDLYDIREHPRFQGELATEEDDEGSLLVDLSDREPESISEAEAPTSTDPIGLNVCYLCKHRRDQRPWWRRLLSRPRGEDLGCYLFDRREAYDPVTGDRIFLEKQASSLGWTWVPVEKPLRPCREINPDGHCAFFTVAAQEESLKGEL